jgi:ABC-type transport system involved in cytochrome c biogenesis ATPase subunit
MSTLHGPTGHRPIDPGEPGLTLILGDEGSGKTAMLRRIAESARGTVCWWDPQTVSDEQQTALQCLSDRADGFPRWNEALAREAIEALRLDEHLDKALFMLSTGTRRKLALVAAWASRADHVLLDLPFAALDARSRQALAGRLMRQASDPQGASWVITDYERPPGLAPGLPIRVIDLGEGAPRSAP